MQDKLRKALSKLDQQQLLEAIEDLCVIAKVEDSLIAKYLLSTADKVKLINKTFSKYKRRTKFHDYYQAIEFFQLLEQEVLQPIKQLTPDAPQECAGVLQTILDSFVKLCEAKDDSSGCAMDFLYTTAQLWGLAWANVPERDMAKLVDLVYQYHTTHGYLHYPEFLEYFKRALGAEGLVLLEDKLKDQPSSLLKVIELQNDVDKYLAIGPSISGFNNTNRLQIAQMFLNDFRTDDAIKLLLSMSTDSRDYQPKQDLLIKAYSDNGDNQNCQKIRIETFLETPLLNE